MGAAVSVGISVGATSMISAFGLSSAAVTLDAGVGSGVKLAVVVGVIAVNSLSSAVGFFAAGATFAGLFACGAGAVSFATVVFSPSLVFVATWPSVGAVSLGAGVRRRSCWLRGRRLPGRRFGLPWPSFSALAGASTGSADTSFLGISLSARLLRLSVTRLSSRV